MQLALISDGLGSTGDERWIVQLRSPSLVQVFSDGSGDIPELPGGKPDLSSGAAEKHLAALRTERSRFVDALARSIPGARVDHQFEILYNGLIVAGAGGAERLQALPGVRQVYRADTLYYSTELDASLDLIDAASFWETVGGPDAAGQGVKVAVIDSGIDIYNPFFDPAGFTMPVGFPKGEAAFTTSKVIAARAYFRADDPPNPEQDTMDPVDHGGHGSHCAGIIAGNAGTVFDLNGTPATVSGVAPGAQLMNYKVFYNAQSGQTGAFDSELMAAFEDAVADGADVISCSWGGADAMVDLTPSGLLYQSAIDAGAVVVFASGNEGSGPGTVGHPGTLPRVLTAGSVNTGRYYAGHVDVQGPGTVPSDLVGMAAVRGSISPVFVSEPVGPTPVISARIAGEGLNDDGCLTYPYGAFEGVVALVERGNCPFTQKIDYAYLAGAVAVIVFNNLDDAAAITMGGEDVLIPAVQLGNLDGLELEKWTMDNHPAATVTIHDTMMDFHAESNLEVMAGSSSRGPTDRPILKPEISAPGVNILSANAHWPGSDGNSWGLKSGTSMACPHVSGAATLVRQKHPGLKPEHVQAMLVASAREDFATQDLTDSTDVGSGILDLEAASTAGAYTIPPSISFGEGAAGDTLQVTLKLHDTYWYAGDPPVSWEHEQAAGAITSPEDGVHVDMDDDELTVTIQFPEGASSGEYTGRLRFDGYTDRVTIPYHARILPQVEDQLLLLDLSFLQEEQKVLVDLYSDLAEQAGLSHSIMRVVEEGPAPTLDDLLRHETILVFTGKDQVVHKRSTSTHTLDALSSYARGGGNLIIAGQGPLRDNDHKRIHGFTGCLIKSEFPFFDPFTQEVVELEDYLVHPMAPDEGMAFTDLPVDIGPETDGDGDLVLVGDLSAMMGSGLPDLFVHPFMKMESDIFWGDMGLLGMLFDPYEGYGIYEEIEDLKGRAAMMGFGFERIGSQTDLTSSRSELFENLYAWVSERVDVELEVETDERHIVLNLIVDEGEAESISVDFGDGSSPVMADNDTVYYEYEELGQYEITVLARAPLGAADIERLMVNLEETPEEITDAGVDTDEPPAEYDAPVYDERVRDCGCDLIGAGERYEPGGSLLLDLLPLLII